MSKLHFVLLSLLLGLTATFMATTEAQPGLGPVTLVNAYPGLKFAQPVAIANAGDGRLFIVEQAGRIQVITGMDQAAVQKPFLDISPKVQDGGERGLLGLAFHPDYQNNGFFYVNYTLMIGEQLTTHVSRFQVSADPGSADPNSEVVLLTVTQPYNNHNGGDLHFDPQGYLVIGLGDGGSGGDPGNRAQDGRSLLGKLLRIDVDRVENGRNYAIPPDNPFIGQPAQDEIWALGLRNPWRFSFDRLTGDLYVGDVGQSAWEEINFRSMAEMGGENYGWRLKEGFACYNPAQDCDPGGLTDPVHVYSHAEGCSVTGGVVYRGNEVPALAGVYLYTDYCGSTILGLRRDGAGRWQNGRILDGPARVTAFGEDAAGEVYLASQDTGAIYRFAQQQPGVYLPLVSG
jgi:glucose/arabinose dehydrogenase